MEENTTIGNAQMYMSALYAINEYNFMKAPNDFTNI